MPRTRWTDHVERTLTPRELGALKDADAVLSRPEAHTGKELTEAINTRSRMVCRVIDRAGLTHFDADAAPGGLAA